MVRIEGNPVDEKALRKKTDKLEEITRRVAPNQEISFPITKNYFSIARGRVLIIPENNRVITDSRSYFNLALNLADAYEKETKENWTLKRLF